MLSVVSHSLSSSKPLFSVLIATVVHYVLHPELTLRNHLSSYLTHHPLTSLLLGSLHTLFQSETSEPRPCSFLSSSSPWSPVPWQNTLWRAAQHYWRKSTRPCGLPSQLFTWQPVMACSSVQSFHTSTKSFQNSGHGLASHSLLPPPPPQASECRLSSLPLFQSFPLIPWSQLTCNPVFVLTLFKITLLKVKIYITNGRPTIFLSWFLYSPEWLSSLTYTKFIFFHHTLNAGSLCGLFLAPCCVSSVACMPMTHSQPAPGLTSKEPYIWVLYHLTLPTGTNFWVCWKFNIVIEELSSYPWQSF